MPTWSDAWLFMALSLGNGELSEVIAVADGLNHAIPTPDEWMSALQVLGSRGLIDHTEPLPRLTGLGRKTIRGFRASHMSFAALAAKLSSLPIVDEEPFPAPSTEMLQDGFKTYESRAWKLINRKRS